VHGFQLLQSEVMWLVLLSSALQAASSLFVQGEHRLEADNVLNALATLTTHCPTSVPPVTKVRGC